MLLNGLFYLRPNLYHRLDVLDKILGACLGARRAERTTDFNSLDLLNAPYAIVVDLITR